MFLKVLFGFIFFCCISCGGNSSSTVDTNNEKTLLGSWTADDGQTSCSIDTVVFNNDGTHITQLSDKILTGKFTSSQLESNSQRYSILFTIDTDNGLSDCDGDSSSNVGKTIQVYYEIVDGKLNMFAEESSISPYFVYKSI